MSNIFLKHSNFRWDQTLGSYVDGSDSGDYSGDSSGNESLEKRGKVTDRAHQTDRGTIRKGINYDSDQTKSTSSSSESNVTEAEF